MPNILSLLSIPANFTAGRELVRSLVKNRSLAWAIAKRDITDQFAGQILGSFWAILHPVFLIVLYIFIFSIVMKQKMGGTVELPFDYTVYLLSGLIPWLAFQAVIARATTAISSQASLVKQVVFPIELLPAKVLPVALLPQIVGLFLLIVYVGVEYKRFPLTYLMLPAIILMQIVFMLGLSYLLSSIGVFLRDLKDFVQVFSTVGVFLLPIFYLPSNVPGAFKLFVYVNPFSYPGWCFQDVLYFGRIEHPWAWLVFFAETTFTFCIGYRLHRYLKPQFGNFL